MLLTKRKGPQQRLAYSRSAITHGWPRNVLNLHVETRLLERGGAVITNSATSLP